MPDLPLLTLSLLDAATLLPLAQEPPEPEEVKAGWTALVIFLLLVAAVAVLGFSLSKQLRKTQRAKEAGVYGDTTGGETTNGPSTDGSDDGPDEDGSVRR